MTKIQDIFVPEDHFTDVPDSFSAESRITGVDARVNTNGIILDSLKEVELVLRIHNGEERVGAISSMATIIDLIASMHDSAGPMGAGLIAFAHNKFMKDVDFVGTMMAEARSNIATKGEYLRSYDYDAMGSNFLKTSVNIRKVEEKFVLNISAAYVGNRSEIELAVLLGRRVALSSVSIDVSMSVVDDWWYNLNPRTVLGDILEFDDEGWKLFADTLADKDKSVHMTQEREGELIELHFNVDYSYYRYVNKDGERDRRTMMKAVGSNIAGAAWDGYRHDGEEAKSQEKKLKLTVKFPSTGYSTPPVVDPVKTEILTAAAQEIVEKISQKIELPGG